MSTFDYEKAWQDLALPAYQKLTEPVIKLVAQTGVVAENLHQDRGCDMIWPDDGGKFRAMFDSMDTVILANAAHVVYFYSHWRPGADIAGNAPHVPGGWKFSNYADQVLRNRFNIARDGKEMIGLRIHKGTVRVCYSSDNMWTWHEVAPATDAGMEAAHAISTDLRRKVAIHEKMDNRDSAAYKFFEALKTTVAWAGFDSSGYMVDESELELRRAARMPKPSKEKLLAEIKQDFDSKLASMTTERDGMAWLIKHDLPTANAIYYNHTGRFCFGWRTPLTGTAREQLLAALAKFPWNYDVK